MPIKIKSIFKHWKDTINPDTDIGKQIEQTLDKNKTLAKYHTSILQILSEKLQTQPGKQEVLQTISEDAANAAESDLIQQIHVMVDEISTKFTKWEPNNQDEQIKYDLSVKIESYKSIISRELADISCESLSKAIFKSNEVTQEKEKEKEKTNNNDRQKGSPITLKEVKELLKKEAEINRQASFDNAKS